MFGERQWERQCLGNGELTAAFRKTRLSLAFLPSKSGFSAGEAEHNFVFAHHGVARVDERMP